MSDKAKTALVPKLRFPEFRDSGEWTKTQLFVLADKVVTRNRDSFVNRVLTNSALDGVVDQSDYFDRDIANHNNLENYYVIDIGDYVYNPRISVTAPVGPISKNKIGRGVISPLYTVFRFKSTNNDFYEQYFKTNLWHNYLRSVSNTGARYDRMSISNDAFFEMPLPYNTEKEQQKIADCLSSFDDLIAAENKKLSALRTYKKGLMQKLFPADGKTVPEWRFPEFRDSGEWENKTIDEISENVIAGGTPSTLNSEFWNGSIRWMSSGDLNKKEVYDVTGRITEIGLRKSSTKLIPEQCVLIGLAGQGKTRGTVAVNMVELCINQSIAAIFPNKKIFNSNFIYYNLDSRYDELRKLSTGDGGRGGLNLKIIKSLPVSLPTIDEQQKIADCLSAADAIITAQTKRIETLKMHKKGLMQGLFPSVEEVEV